MTNSTEREEGIMDTESSTISRRDLLKRGALVGGAVLWVAPFVQVVGMGKAFAKDVSLNCSRYCLKWNVDDNSETPGLTCINDVATHAHPVWSNNWEELAETLTTGCCLVEVVGSSTVGRNIGSVGTRSCAKASALRVVNNIAHIARLGRVVGP